MFLDIKLRSIYNNIVFTQKDVWAYYVLPPARFDFASNTAKLQASTTLDSLLSSLSGATREETEVHLVVFPIPLDVEQWQTGLIDATNRITVLSQVGRDFISEQAAILQEARMTEKTTLLGVRLGSRLGFASEDSISPLKDLFYTTKNALDKLLFVKDVQVSKGELKEWARAEEQMMAVVSSTSLVVQRALPYQIALMVQRAVNPNPVIPPTRSLKKWGAGAIKSLVPCHVKEKASHLHFSYNDSPDSYMQCLCFSSFPNTVSYPMATPWIFAASVISPGTWYSGRYTLVSPDKVVKALSRNLKMTEDERQNASVAGAIPMELMERLTQVERLEYRMKNDSSPWIYGTHQLNVQSFSESELKESVTSLTKYYHQQDIGLVAPMGSQWPLFMQSLPGDMIRVSDYIRKQTLSMIGAAMPNASSEVGDRVEW